MATFRFSRLAEADLLSIGVYTLRTWGEAQTIRYIDELEDCCQRLANPASGRPCDHIRPAFTAWRQASTSFFRREPAGIVVSRIMRERMLPERHAFDDDD